MKTLFKSRGMGLGALLGVAGGAAAISASPAGASVSDPIIHVQATNAQGSGTFDVPLSMATMLPGGSFLFSLASPQDITSGPNTIATITQMTTFIRPQAGALPNMISLGFAVQAGNADTTFTIDTATFSFASLAAALGRASAGVGVTDTNGDGVTLTPAQSNGSVYQTFYDSTLFASLITAPVMTNVPNGSASSNDAAPGGGAYSALSGPVSSMRAEWRFTLSAQDMAGDTAGGTGVWEVIPSPGALSLLGLGGLVGLRRARR